MIDAGIADVLEREILDLLRRVGLGNIAVAQGFQDRFNVRNIHNSSFLIAYSAMCIADNRRITLYDKINIFKLWN